MGSPEEGLRERKRRETRQRIADAGLQLFFTKGYEETTLDAIAEAAQISRRTFFSYFESKEEILHAAHAHGFQTALRESLAEIDPAGRAPFEVVREVLPKVIERFDTKESFAIDRLLHSTGHLRAQKQQIYVDWEQAIYDGLAVVWPARDRQAGLRLVAMTTVGTTRIAMDRWREERAKHPIAYYLRKAFKALEAEL